MPKRDIVVIGASLGGIEALKRLTADLARELRAALFVVLHSAASSPGVLPLILTRAGPLPASNAVDGEPIRLGHIFVAPPDRHMLLDPHGFVRVAHGPKENLWRPAVDPLFRSAACAFGNRVVGVILTGGLDDGSAGLWAIKSMGGTAVVQDPGDAIAPSMPLNALERLSESGVDYCVPLSEIGALLSRLTEETVKENEASPSSDKLQKEIKIALGEAVGPAETTGLGTPSPFACPECHGVLSEIKEGDRSRFRCHTGHAYSAQSLLEGLGTATEDAIWNAIRAIEERIMLFRKVAGEVQSKNMNACRGYLEEAAKLEERCEELRRIVLTKRA